MKNDSVINVQLTTMTTSDNETDNMSVQRWCLKTAEWFAAGTQSTEDDEVLQSVAVEPTWTCYCHLPLYSLQCLQQPTSRRQLCSSCCLPPAVETRYPSPPCRCSRHQFVDRTVALNTQQLSLSDCASLKLLRLSTCSSRIRTATHILFWLLRRFENNKEAIKFLLISSYRHRVSYRPNDICPGNDCRCVDSLEVKHVNNLTI